MSERAHHQVEASVSPVRPTSEETRARLSRVITTLFRHWQLDSKQQAILLGLAPTNRASLSAYKRGKALPNSIDMLDRVGHLLSIHKSLRILFPHDRQIAYSWVSSPNRAFNGMSPLDVMTQYRFAGLLKVRAYLDFAQSR